MLPITKMALPKELQQLSYYLDYQGMFNYNKYKLQKLRHHFKNKNLIQNLFEIQKGICNFCKETIDLDNNHTKIHDICSVEKCSNKNHKIIAKKRENLRLLHQTCYKTIHYNEDYYSKNNVDYFIKYF